MNASPRSILAALLCGGVQGCAILPAVGINLASQGIAALAIAPISAMDDRKGGGSCTELAARGITVAESLESAVPTDGKNMDLFEPASWRPEFASEGYPQVERMRTPVDGTLVVAERSLLFVPVPGAASIRIPYELVQEVEVPGETAGGGARATIVRSCFGRFDVFTFHLGVPAQPDSRAAAAAGAQLNARVAAYRTAADITAAGPR